MGRKREARPNVKIVARIKVIRPILSELEDILAENKRLRAQIKGYKGLAASGGGFGAASRPAYEEPDSVSVGHRESSGRMKFTDPLVHNVKVTDSTCSTCHDRNPFFKDETFCDPDKGGCGRSLGAISTLKDVPFCPRCKATDTASPKLSRWVGCSSCRLPVAATEEEALSIESCPNGDCHGHTLEWMES